MKTARKAALEGFERLYAAGDLTAAELEEVKTIINNLPPTRYQRRKETARMEAIDWQASAGDQNYSYGELADRVAYFEKLGRRYGLLTEFRENGII